MFRLFLASFPTCSWIPLLFSKAFWTFGASYKAGCFDPPLADLLRERFRPCFLGIATWAAVPLDVHLDSISA